MTILQHTICIRNFDGFSMDENEDVFEMEFETSKISSRRHLITRALITFLAILRVTKYKEKVYLT